MRRIIRNTAALLFCPLVLAAPAEKPQIMDTVLAPGLKMTNETTIEAPANFLEDFAGVNGDGSVNAVVEIPTGTNAKWEVKDDGQLHWDLKDGTRRVVKYLSYVGNYGMVPRTKQGDGDPIDILVLAPPYPRGSVVQVRVIGALRFSSKGEQDDKLLAVVPDTPLGSAGSLRGLQEKFPGVTDIVRIWFQNYKGKGHMEFMGQVEKEDAMQLLAEAGRRFSADAKKTSRQN